MDAAFDTVGTQQTQLSALSLLASGGTLVNLVANQTPITLSLMDLSGERRIVGSANNNYDDLLVALRLLGTGGVNLKAMITHRFPLSDVAAGFDAMERKTQTGAVKVIILP